MPTYILVIVYMIMAGTFTPILRHVSGVFSPFVQNGVRFLIGGLLILTLSILQYRKNKESFYDFIPFVKKKYYFFLMIIACMSITMVFMSLGLKYTSSFMCTMFVTFGIPATTVVAAIFFPDERKKVAHFTFIIGMIICMIGSYIFVQQGDMQDYSTKGVIYLTISVVAQIILNNLIKYMTREHSVVYVSTINSLGVSVVLLILSVITGQIHELTTVPPIQIIILIFAGLYGIFMGMVLGFTLLKKTGISNFNILQLINPIVVAIFAYIFFNEKNISYNQIKGAIIIISGSAICIFGRKIYNYLRSKSW